MKKISFTTTYNKISADIYTPVGIYLRLRDRFRDTILLESTDFHVAENSYSIIGINAIAGIEISDEASGEMKYPGQNAEKISVSKQRVPDLLWSFLQRLQAETEVKKPVKIAQGLFGYTAYDAVSFFENIRLNTVKGKDTEHIPLIRYRLYQYIIIIDHFKDELYICENHFAGLESEIENVVSLIKSKDVPVFPFQTTEEELQLVTAAMCSRLC